MAKIIPGFDERDFPAVDIVSNLLGHFCVENGMDREQYVHAGVVAADNAGELIFTALRHMGLIAGEGVDPKLFQATAQNIIQQEAPVAEST